MATLSTFELLVKPLVPLPADKLGAGRTVIQGYFLTISNTSTLPVSLRLKFTAKSPAFTAANVLAFFDILGVNTTLPIPLAPATTETLTFTLNIGPGDTGLFILQPDVTDPLLITNPTTEIRGYVDIALTTLFGSNTYNLLVTPEHRGTFLPRGFTVPTPPLPSMETRDFDQLVYTLPTAQGKALYTLKQVTLTPISTEVSELQSIVELMAERLDDTAQQSAVRNQAFIPEGGIVQPQPVPTRV